MDNFWTCVNEECHHPLGRVVGGEFIPSDDVGGKYIKTRGPNVVIYCPECGTRKIWYTADQLTRAGYQLVDALATILMKRTMSLLTPEVTEMVRKVMRDTANL